MTYEDLPMYYRTHAEEQGWEENRALSYWKAAEPYRDVVEAQMLSYMKGWIGNDEGAAFSALDHALYIIRGRRSELT